MLTGARSLFTLDLARRLHEWGCHVFTAETSHFHICRFSNAIKKNFIVPSPRFRSQEFIEALVAITKQEAIDLLIPSFEEIFCLSKGIGLFPPSCQIFCADYEMLDVLHNKWRFNQKIKDLGFLAPKSYLIQSQEDLDSLPLKPPYILKPSYSRASLRVRKVTVERSVQIEVDRDNPLVAQEWLGGKKLCSYSIVYRGKIFAHAVYPVDFSIDGSSCLNFRAIDHEKIEMWVESFVKKQHFTGQIAFDFIESPKGDLYAIECNPRGTSGLHLFQKKDELPKAFFGMNSYPIYPQCNYSKQIACGMLLYGWRGRLGRKDLFYFIKQFFTIRDVIFSKKDLRPFFFQPILLFIYLLKSFKLRTSLPVMFTFDIDWNGQALIDREQA